MIIAKQMDIRANIKKYFDMAYEGDAIIVPRKENRNVVIISEDEYNALRTEKRLLAYADGVKAVNEAASVGVKKDNLNKLQTIANLTDNWNGNGAKAFDRGLINKVRKLLNELSIQPEIFPTALQTIQFEYDNNRRDHMEIEIGQEDEAEIFYVQYNGSEFFETINVNASAINKRVEAFYG